MLKDFNINNGKKHKIFDLLHQNIVAIIIAVVVIAGVVSTVVILNSKSKPEAENGKIKTYEAMDSVYFAVNAIRDYNPITSADSDVYYMSQLVYSGLFKLDKNLTPIADLTESYTTDSKKGAVSVTLKSGAKFSDGSSLTSGDVKFTVERIMAEGKDCPYYLYASKIDYVEAESDTKLTVHFESPTDAAVDNLVFPVVSKKGYYSDDNNILGSGPYKYGSRDSKAIYMNPNENYYGTVAKNTIEFKIVPDSNLTMGLMTMDAVTAYVSTDSNADADAEDKRLAAKGIPSSQLEYMGFNFRNQYLASKDMRQAIATAIDANAIIEDNYGGSAIACDSVYFPGFLGTENKGDAYPYDPKAATDILKKEGFVDSDNDGILEDENGRTVSFNIVVYSGDSSRADTASTVSEALGLLGINSSVKKLSWDEYQEALKTKDFDICIGGYKFDKQYNLKELFEIGNVLSYNSEEVVSLVNKLETALTAEEQKSTYSSLKGLLTDELPYYCICYKNYSFVTVKKFTGKEIPTFFDVYRGCGSWEWEKIVTTKEEESES